MKAEHEFTRLRVPDFKARFFFTANDAQIPVCAKVNGLDQSMEPIG
jgi:hypothetical protein